MLHSMLLIIHCKIILVIGHWGMRGGLHEWGDGKGKRFRLSYRSRFCGVRLMPDIPLAVTATQHCSTVVTGWTSPFICVCVCSCEKETKWERGEKGTEATTRQDSSNMQHQYWDNKHVSTGAQTALCIICFSMMQRWGGVLPVMSQCV